jgi:Mlc titration factor MtfA (ptsG expression regulator)
MTDDFLKRKEIPGVGPYIGGTYVHETGHHVWYTKMTTEERNMFEHHYDRNINQFEKNLGHYSTKSVREGWAEATRYYKVKPEYLKEKMPDTYDMVDSTYKRIKANPEKAQPTSGSIFD